MDLIDVTYVSVALLIFSGITPDLLEYERRVKCSEFALY